MEKFNTKEVEDLFRLAEEITHKNIELKRNNKSLTKTDKSYITNLVDAATEFILYFQDSSKMFPENFIETMANRLK